MKINRLSKIRLDTANTRAFMLAQILKVVVALLLWVVIVAAAVIILKDKQIWQKLPKLGAGQVSGEKTA